MQYWECLIKVLFEVHGNHFQIFEEILLTTIQIKKPFIQQLINNPMCDFD